MVMTFLKGPKLLHDSLGVGGAGLDLDDLLLLNSPASRNWVMGALFLVGSSSCWSLLYYFTGSDLQIVRGSPDAVGLDVLPVHGADGVAQLLRAAGPRRLEDQLALRAHGLHLRRKFIVVPSTFSISRPCRRRFRGQISCCSRGA